MDIFLLVLLVLLVPMATLVLVAAYKLFSYKG
jgi:hypothetical protein